MRSVVRADEDAPVGIVSVLGFGCELAMLALLVYAGWRLGGSTVTRILLAIALPALAIAIWSAGMAPNSSVRLRDPARLIAQIVLFAAVGTVVAVAGPGWVGLAFAVVASAVFALSRRLA